MLGIQARVPQGVCVVGREPGIYYCYCTCMACDRANPTPHNPPVGCLHPRTLNHDTTAHATVPSLSLSSLGVRNNPSSTQAHDDDDGRVAGLRPAVDVLNDSHDLSEVPGHVPARRAIAVGLVVTRKCYTGFPLNQNRVHWMISTRTTFGSGTTGAATDVKLHRTVRCRA